MIARSDKVIKLDNSILFVKYDLTDNVFSVSSGNRRFLKDGQFEKAVETLQRAIEVSGERANPRTLRQYQNKIR